VEIKVSLEREDSLVGMDLLDQEARLDQMDLMALLVHQGLREPLVTKDLLDLLDFQDREVFLDPRVEREEEVILV